uniref:Thioredoxin H-type 5 n=1 Tax=Arundo donax TaxID=35708 RepID=A0A0A9EL34_ARUDO
MQIPVGKPSLAVRCGAYFFTSRVNNRTRRPRVAGEVAAGRRKNPTNTQADKKSERSKMGSFFSSFLPPAPAPADDPNSAVIAAHSKATWDEQWEAHKSAAKLMVIDFSASWCGPCRFIEPAFKEMASRFTDAIFVKIDVDELAVRFRQPDVVFFTRL